MPFTVLANSDKHLTKVTVIGKPSFIEGVGSYKNFYDDNTSMNLMWDFRKASLAKLSLEQIQEAINSTIPYAEKRSGGKTAIVVSKDLDYNKFKMIAEFIKRKNIPIKYKIFQAIEKAIEWLEEDENGTQAQISM